jgi:tetratricopeptide (TPR) repeat protein
MDKQGKLKRYRRKDYDRLIDFPVEIVGRDGKVRRYSFEEAIRFYQQRVATASARYEDAEVASAEAAHCWRRITQLRRSYSERHGWAGLRDALEGFGETGDLGAEVAAFLRRHGPRDEEALTRLSLAPLDQGPGSRVFSLRIAGSPSEGGLRLLYLFSFSNTDPEPARAAFKGLVRALEEAPGQEGVERLLALHQGADCGLVLTSPEAGPSHDADQDADGDLIGPPAEDAEPLAEVLARYARGDLEGALRELGPRLESNAYDHRATLLASALAEGLRRHGLAEFHARRATLNVPSDPGAWYCLGVSLYHQGRFAEAEEVLRRAALGAPGRATPPRTPSVELASLLLALLAWRSGRHAEAHSRLVDLKLHASGWVRRYARLLAFRIASVRIFRWTAWPMLVAGLLLAFPGRSWTAAPLIAVAITSLVLAAFMARTPTLDPPGAPLPRRSEREGSGQAPRRPPVPRFVH